MYQISSSSRVFPLKSPHICQNQNNVKQCPDDLLYRRWSEVTRRLELWVQLMELNEAGDFTAVEVLPAKDVRTGGVFQLKQVMQCSSSMLD